MPEWVNLATMLDEPDEDTPYLIGEVWPLDGHVVLAAAAKAGKTTLRNNTVRSLVDGVPFLGRFEVPRRVDRVVVLDLELTKNTLRRWFREQRIQNTHAVDLIPMRGQAHTLDVFHPGWCADWAKVLHGADVVVLDCLEPVLHSLGLDPNTEARKFLEAWGAMLTEAGVGASLVLHHHGHGSERAKGDSGILAWADALWDITLQDPSRPGSSPRFWTAYGRLDGDHEGGLDHEDDTGRLTFVGGVTKASAKGQQQAADASTTLLQALRDDHETRVGQGDPVPSDGCSVRWESRGAVEAVGKKAGLSRDPTRAAIDQLAAQDLPLVARSAKGSAGAQQHALTKKGMEATNPS